MFIIFKDWYADDDEEKYRKITLSVWPFALSIGLVAIFYRISGILLDRTTEVGEILLAKGD